MVRGHGQVGRHVAVDFAVNLEGGVHFVVGHDDDDGGGGWSRSSIVVWWGGEGGLMCEEEEDEHVCLAEEARFVRQATRQAGLGEGLGGSAHAAKAWTTKNAMCMSRSEGSEGREQQERREG